MDERYLEIFLEPIRKCNEYKPKMGTSEKCGVDLGAFKVLYGGDQFYSWIGLDSDLMYAAHKAAGGMTSIYRQIGVGCERLFREIIIDTTKYDDRSLAEWSYSAQTQSGKSKTLSLDGRLEIDSILDEDVKSRVKAWLNTYCEDLGARLAVNGVVFEVRQGYKSKDSKRQNADMDNASVAWSKGYLPVFAIFSSQIDTDIVLRYRNSSCGVLIGINSDNTNASLFAFTKDILGYDMSGFFDRNSGSIKSEITVILKNLLSAQ